MISVGLPRSRIFHAAGFEVVREILFRLKLNQRMRLEGDGSRTATDRVNAIWKDLLREYEKPG